jgi:predicted SAM-dependent methyltransferase
MKAIAKRILGNSDLLKRSRQALWYIEHRFSMRDRAIVRRYLSQSQFAKLHIGSGENFLPGWLNVDYFPSTRDTLYLDARRPFFFRDGTFDYVFCEHMIEHIPYNSGLKMLAECRRVLKGSGKIRISTPNLAFLLDLYRPDKSTLQREYIKWALRTFVKGHYEEREVFVINNFVRNWGHTFIYDEPTLRNAMANSGFTDIIKLNLQESEDPTLRNLENERRMPSGFLQMETLTLEGTKSG